MESEFISWLRQRLPAHHLLEVGLGDDAALLRLRENRDLLVSVDVLTDGVDFHLDQVDPRRIGHKALAVNLSDIAAMGGKPLAVVIGAVLPRSRGLELAKQICEGMLPLAERYDVAIAGGDTNTWDGPLVLSVTVLGQPHARGAIRRSGAQVGDAIVVTGSFGGSILGHHLDFEPRLLAAQRLVEHYDIHAAIDCSDGLSLDLSRIAKESRCGAVLSLTDIPIAEAAATLANQLHDGSTPLDHALGDGEDFELIMAVPQDDARRMLAEQPLDVSLSIIGEFIDRPGLWQRDARGAIIHLQPRGFEH